ncbi:hypothetical protein ACVWZ3_008245 [Bradyrhizobium sp. i1.3.6]
MRDVVQDPGNHPAPHHQHQPDEHDDLGQGQHHDAGKPEAGLRGQRLEGWLVTAGALKACDRREQHQHEHHREVLDDEPADRDAAAIGLHQAPLLQRAKQDHSARDRQRQSEHESRTDAPAHQP